MNGVKVCIDLELVVEELEKPIMLIINESMVVFNKIK